AQVDDPAQSNVDVVGGLGDWGQHARVGQVDGDGAIVDAVAPGQRRAQVVQHGQAPRDQHHVDARIGKLVGEFASDPRRRAGHYRPWAELMCVDSHGVWTLFLNYPDVTV